MFHLFFFSAQETFSPVEKLFLYYCHCYTVDAIGNPERHVRKASHRGSKQQQRSCVAISLIIACSLHVYIFLFFTHISFVVNHTINVTPPERLQHSTAILQRSPVTAITAFRVGKHPSVSTAMMFCAI